MIRVTRLKRAKHPWYNKARHLGAMNGYTHCNRKIFRVDRTTQLPDLTSCAPCLRNYKRSERERFNLLVH